MKNVNANQLKTCIYLYLDQFEDICTYLFGDNVAVNCGSDGLQFDIYEDEDAEGYAINTDYIYNKLADYFDISEITTIHDDGYQGIWVVYKA